MGKRRTKRYFVNLKQKKNSGIRLDGLRPGSSGLFDKIFPVEGDPYGKKGDGFKSLSCRLATLKEGVDQYDFEVVFCLNVLTSDLRYQLKMLRAAQAKGISVKYVELGNELFFGDKLFRLRFDNGEEYAKEMAEWVAAIKREFPTAKVALAGNLKDYNHNDDRRDQWNAAIFEHVEDFDALTIHVYPEYAHFALGNDKGQPNLVAKHLVRTLEGMHFDVEVPENIDVWVTEYNLFNKGIFSGQVKKTKIWTTWLHGLFISAATLRFCESSNNTQLLNHTLLAKGNSIGALSVFEKGGLNILTAVGLQLEVLFKLMNESDTMVRLSFENSSSYHY
jgi:hypothetical protein